MAGWTGSIQATVFFRAPQNGLCQLLRPRGALTQDLPDVRQVRRQFGAFRAGAGEVTPIVLEERLLQITVAEPPGAQTVFVIAGDTGGRNQLEQLQREVFLRVRLRL